MPLFPLAALAVILFVLNIFERRLARSRYTQGGRTRSEIKPMRRLFAGRRRRSAVVLQGGCVNMRDMANGSRVSVVGKRSALAIFYCIIVFRWAAAFDPSTGATYVFNGTGCGQYAQDRKLPRETQPHVTDAFYVAGWLSALNATVPGINVEGDTRIDETLLWLDWYCLNHPFNTMQDGLIVLGREIARHSVRPDAKDREPH